MVDSPKGKLCIADNGYQWLELAPKDGKAMIIDEDELLEAYKDGVIDAEEYDLARTVASQVLDLFSDNKNNLEVLIRKRRSELNA